MDTTISTEDALAHAITHQTAVRWHLTTVLTADDQARLQRLVDAHNATMLIHGERPLTAQQWLAAQIPGWLEAEERAP